MTLRIGTIVRPYSDTDGVSCFGEVDPCVAVVLNVGTASVDGPEGKREPTLMVKWWQRCPSHRDTAAPATLHADAAWEIGQLA